jgi:hypothetical protein
MVERQEATYGDQTGGNSRHSELTGSQKCLLAVTKKGELR